MYQIGHALNKRLLLAAAIAATCVPAFAQQASTTAEAPVLQEVIVTGSRIPVPPNISATSPIAVVTGQEIQLQGHTDISDVLNALPQSITSAGVDTGNTSTPLSATGGFTTVDLRGLGPQRTLVLINGRRLGVGDPSTTNPNPAPDIDQIPAPLLERIDVVTGGASATYGSDAIAGVVNFILKKNFQGIQIDGQYGFSDHDQHDSYVRGLLSNDDPNTGWRAVTPPTGNIRDGHKHDLSVLMGTNFADGNGNVTGYFVYHDQNPVSGKARDFADCQLGSTNQFGAPAATGVECAGSSNSNRFTPTRPPATLGVLPSANTRFTVVGNQFLPWPQAGSSPPAVFDYNAYEYLQREDKRYQGGFLAHDDLNDWVKPYVEFGFMQDKSIAQVAPSGLFTASNPLTKDTNYLVNCSNPLLSAQQKSAICTPAQIAGDIASPGSAGNSADLVIGRRNIEGGGRTSIYEHTNFRVVSGVQGGLGDAWSYDGYYSYYYVTAFSANQNYLDYSAINKALQVTTDAAGAPACISGGKCIPYNIFMTGGVTPAQLNYLSTPGTSQGNNTEEIAHLDVTGDLGKWGITSPFAKDGLGVNVGAEHRAETVTFAPDGAELAGNLAGFSGASVPTDVNYHVNEAFVEARAPLAQNLPGVQDLTADVGYRWSNYSTAGITNTYKFEVQYAPIEDARMRFSFDRAVRAPNLVELFNAQSYGQENTLGVDPCAPTSAPASASLANCMHTGVTAAEYGNGLPGKAYTGTIIQCVSGQCGQVIGGNPNLKPEVAKTWSLGFTVTPTAVPGFTASVDYYHIKLEDQVGAYPFAVILNGCLQNNNPLYCSQIVRTGQGSLTGASVASGGYFIQRNYNLGLSIFSGIDLQMNYRYALPAGWGTLSAALNGAWLQHDTTTPFPGSASYDCAHLFGSTCSNGTVNPTWRHNLRISWDTPWNVLFSMQWRFIGPTTFDNNSTNALLAGAEEGIFDNYNSHIPGYSYLDLTAIWHVTHNLELRAGAENVLDKDPPLIPSLDITASGGPGNTYNTYDLLGRQVFVAFTAKF